MLRLTKITLLLACFLPFALSAQEKGVHWTELSSWKEVKAKAKAENKYIFLDCFTTWCGPCRFMRTQILTKEEAGNYFNDKFISVEVQLDTTAKDNSHVTGWYADAHAIMKQYSISAFPTYLIFTPDGQVLHRLVGGSNSAKDFASRVEESFDTTKQYYAKLAQFENGRRDSVFLNELATAAYRAYDYPTGKKAAKAYLNSQPNWYTPGAWSLINTYTSRSTDEFFDFIATHAAEIDKAIGAGVAEKKLRKITLNEMGGIDMKSAQAPNWDKLQKRIAKSLPADAQEVAMRIKVVYFLYKHSWTSFEKAMVAYMKQYSSRMDDGELNSLAWSVFENCTDMSCVTEILDWSKQLKDSKSSAYVDTYANILYKLGKKDEAIALEQHAIDITPANERGDLQATLDKMKKGEKTWE